MLGQEQSEAEDDSHGRRAVLVDEGRGRLVTRMRRPILHDVARVAGTSHATVSRFLNGHSNVAPATAAAIQEAIAQVSYVPNGTARSLRQQSTMNVAFVAREHADLFYVDPTLSRMAAGANAYLSEHSYQMMLLLVDSPRSEVRVHQMLAGGAFDGALLVAMEVDDPLVRALSQTSAPLVTASAPLPGSPVPSVDTDNVTGSREITAMLCAAGRRRLAEIRGPLSAPVSRLRHAGFLAATSGADGRRGAGVDAREWSFSAGAEAMERVLAQDPDIDAVVVASDLLALGAIQVIVDHGRSVPKDVAVVGFDDAPQAVMSRPSLTTVRQDARRTGELMASLLARQIVGEDLAGVHELTPTEIVWRESAGTFPSYV